MACAANGYDYLVSTNPNDALLFSVKAVFVCVSSEQNQVRNVQYEDGANARVVSAESSCPVTKAVEVCVNGVKQVVIVPLAPSSDDATTLSHSAVLPNVLSSTLSSSVSPGSVPFDGRPDDIKLLAQSCFEFCSSPALPVTLSAMTTLQLPAPTHFSTVSAPLLSHGTACTSHRPWVNLSPRRPPLTVPLQRPVTEVAHQFPIIAPINSANLPPVSLTRRLDTAQQHRINSFRNQPPAARQQPHLLTSAPYQTTAATSLPQYGCTPVLQSRCPVSLPAATFPLGTNTIVHAPFQSQLSHLLQLQSGSSVRVPPLPYRQMQMRSGLTNTANVVTNGLQPGSVRSDHRPTFDVAAQNCFPPNYQHVLPSLPRAPSFHPLLTHRGVNLQLQNYIARKRGILPQNLPHVSPALFGENNFTPQFAPRGSNVARYTPPTCANGICTNSSNTSVTSSYLPTSIAYSSTAVDRQSVKNHPAVHFSQRKSSHSINLPIVPPALQTLSHTRAFQQVASLCTLPQQTAAVTDSNKALLFSRGLEVSSSPLLSNGHVDIRCSVNSLQTISAPAAAIATSAVATNTECIKREDSHRTAIAAQPRSSTSFMMNSLLFDVSTQPPVTTCLSDCIVTTNPIITDLSSDSLRANSLSTSVTTESNIVLQSDARLESTTSQPGDGLDDLGSFPADIIADNAENESLLMSFCELFEQPDNAHDQQSTQGCSAEDKSNDASNEVEKEHDVKENTRQQDAQRALQIAKSVGKGRYFAEQVQERHQEHGNKKRRRARLTALDIGDDSNSSESWHPDSHSEPSDYEAALSPVPSISLSPTPSIASSESSRWSNDSFVNRRTRQSKKHGTTFCKQKRSSRHVISAPEKSKTTEEWPPPDGFTEKCSVVLRQLQLQGQSSVNLSVVSNLFCCSQHNCSKDLKRIVSSDSESSTTNECPVVKKIRIRLPYIHDTDSSS